MNFAFDGSPEAVVAGSTEVSVEQMMSATSSMSSQDIPMLVNAGVPNLIPDVYQAPFGSKGMEFRFTITPASSKALSACLPVRPKLLTSTSTR